MDKKTKEILDQLYADKIYVGEVAKALNMSIEDVFKLEDGYNYVPSIEEVREANKIAKEGYEHIKMQSHNLPVTKVLVIEEMDSEEAKKRISVHLNQISGKIYPSEIAEQLHIDYNLCVEIIEELLQEEKIEIVED